VIAGPATEVVEPIQMFSVLEVGTAAVLTATTEVEGLTVVMTTLGPAMVLTAGAMVGAGARVGGQVGAGAVVLARAILGPAYHQLNCTSKFTKTTHQLYSIARIGSVVPKHQYSVTIASGRLLKTHRR
jgi:hypothetical protein